MDIWLLFSNHLVIDLTKECYCQVKMHTGNQLMMHANPFRTTPTLKKAAIKCVKFGLRNLREMGYFLRVTETCYKSICPNLTINTLPLALNSRNWGRAHKLQEAGSSISTNIHKLQDCFQKKSFAPMADLTTIMSITRHLSHFILHSALKIMQPNATDPLSSGL